MNTLLKVGLAVLVALLVVGCKSMGSVVKDIGNNNKEGIIYGFAPIETAITVKEACNKIKNKDKRCANPEAYFLVTVIPKVGFSSAAWGTLALAEKNFPRIEELNWKGRTGDDDAPYVKAKVNKGRFGDVLEVVSTNGDGKCKWSGMPRAGGVVCEAFGYDYRKDYKGINF